MTAHPCSAIRPDNSQETEAMNLQTNTTFEELVLDKQAEDFLLASSKYEPV